MPENLTPSVTPDPNEPVSTTIPVEGQIADRGLSLVIERMGADVDGTQENPVVFVDEEGTARRGDVLGKSASGLHLLVWPPGGRARVDSPNSDTRMFTPHKVAASDEFIRPV